MKRFTLVTALVLSALLIAPPSGQAQAAQGQGNAQGQGHARRHAENPGLAVPVVGTGTDGAFAGTFTLQRFVPNGTGVDAVGMLTGIVTKATGEAVSVVQTIRIPANVSTGTASMSTAAATISPAAICPILHLDLGPLHLDLLGLQIDLSRVILDITAESGPGNLLGNLLCAIVGLLDSPTGLAQLLNQILSILL